MPTPTPDNLLSLVSSLPVSPVPAGETETQALRRIAREKQAQIEARDERIENLRAEICRLSHELAEAQAMTDNANRRATVAECRLRTAEADHAGEMDALRRSVWPGRDSGGFVCIAKGGE